MTDDVRELLSQRRPNHDAVQGLINFIACSRDITVPDMLGGQTPVAFLARQKPVRLAMNRKTPTMLITLAAEFM